MISLRTDPEGIPTPAIPTNVITSPNTCKTWLPRRVQSLMWIELNIRLLMQNRYTGDIGDFAKYGLLRALGAGKKLGVAWYLYPDESHNADGKHIAYLDTPGKWRHLDPLLFDCLQSIISSKHREVKQIEASVILGDAHYSSVPLAFEGHHKERATQRGKWFDTVLSDLSGCDVVFADPDNVSAVKIGRLF